MHKELSLHANWLVPIFFDEQMKERQMSRLWQLWGWVSRRSNGPARNMPRLQFHYTPKHGSWLNMAELELSVLARQCLDQRLLSMERLRSVIAPWQRGCNEHHVSIRPYSGSQRASLEINTQVEAFPPTTTPTGIESIKLH